MMKTLLLLLVAFMASAMCVVTDAQSAASGNSRTILIADYVVMPDGTLAQGIAVVIENGKIASIIPVDQVADEDGSARIHRYGKNSVLSPGLIDAGSSLAVRGDNFADQAVIDPDTSVIDAVDRQAPELERAVAHGVTVAFIAPSPINVIPGRTAVIRTAQVRGESIALRAFGPLSVVLSSTTWSTERAPSSRAGALTVLRGALDKARRDETDSPLTALAKGEASAAVICETSQDVLSALTLFGKLKDGLVLFHSDHVLEVADEIAQSEAQLVLGPYTFDDDSSELLAAAAMEARGREVAFAGGLPAADPDALRISANLAVRYGLSPEAARRAMTINAATAAGVEKKVGSLANGKLADIVIFSGDPLQLDACVQEVWIAGNMVYATPLSGSLFDEVIGASDDN
ncbi:MAG: amidohydrolase family protein [Phycisphaerales bacterium]